MDTNYVQVVCTCKGTDNPLCPMHSKLTLATLKASTTPCPRCKELEAMFKDRVFAAKAAEAEVDIRGQRIAKLERVANAARCLIGEYGSTVEEHYPEYCGLKEALKGLEG